MAKGNVKEVKKRRSLTMSEKKALIEQAKEAESRGQSMRSFAREHNLNQSTLRGIVNQKAKIESRLHENPNSQSKV